MPEKPKRCFVVMGFGVKTDYATGRKLDLNKSYRLLIKPVVEERGMECIRADEIRHSGSIDVPMYKELLKADVVIADLSTANVNAFYELGIRHALRPYTTVVISEVKLAYPFDLNHIKITSYTHLGDAIDYEEVERFRKELGKTLEAVLKNKEFDSPVYTYLDGLVPPTLQGQLEEALTNKEDEPSDKEEKNKQDPELNDTLSLLAEQGEAAIHQKAYDKAKALFGSAMLVGNSGPESGVSHDSYLVHRLAYATYNAKEPDEVTALEEALTLLGQLDLAHTNDAETVSMAGRIKKRLYFARRKDQDLFDAIQFFERAYFLLHSRYNGINLAFLINHRPETEAFSQPQEIVADLVLANRIRREILEMCDQDVKKLVHKPTGAMGKLAKEDPNLVASQQRTENEQHFWLLVNKAEAHFGLGEIAQYREARRQARALPHEPWMMESFEEQVRKLEVVLKKHGQWLQPSWAEAQAL